MGYMSFVAPYKRVMCAKKTVNGQRIKREQMRHKLALASYVDVPRLVKVAQFKNNPVFGTAYNG